MTSPRPIVLESGDSSGPISNVFHELQVATPGHPSGGVAMSLSGGGDTDHHVTISTSGSSASLLSPGGTARLNLVAAVSGNVVAASSTPNTNVAMQLQAFQQQVAHHEVTHSTTHLGSLPSLKSSGPSLVGGIVTQQSQRLKVEDALSYLDQVKVRFAGQK